MAVSYRLSSVAGGRPKNNKYGGVTFLTQNKDPGSIPSRGLGLGAGTDDQAAACHEMQ